MMVQVRYTNGNCQWVYVSELKVSASGTLLYSFTIWDVFVVDEVLSYASVD